MTDESAVHAGGGASHSGRVGRGGRGWSLFLALALWISASAAMAVEIVEVRIGRHAKFTRVVFELDRVAGYRIERSDPASGVSELIVTLEATSIPRRIESSKTLIEHVDITASGTRSIARIRLARDGLRLKEMILASPPRIRCRRHRRNQRRRRCRRHRRNQRRRRCRRHRRNQRPRRCRRHRRHVRRRRCQRHQRHQ